MNRKKHERYERSKRSSATMFLTDNRFFLLSSDTLVSQVRVLFEAPKLKGHLRMSFKFFCFILNLNMVTSWLTAASRAVNWFAVMRSLWEMKHYRRTAQRSKVARAPSGKQLLGTASRWCHNFPSEVARQCF